MSIMRLFNIATLVLTLSSFSVNAQTDSSLVTITGKAVDEQGNYLSDALIINNRTLLGVFVNLDGTFVYTTFRNDTVRIGAFGRSPKLYCYKDSLEKDTFQVTASLPLMNYYVSQANVIAPRDLLEIQKDIDSLGYDKKDYMLSGIDPLQSPITFLYQQFSKTERSKRKVIELENTDRRRELLKELFRKYVTYEVIDLSEDEFDDFIEYINISDDILKNTSQYDFIVYVKARFLAYKKTLNTDDFDYHKD